MASIYQKPLTLNDVYRLSIASNWPAYVLPPYTSYGWFGGGYRTSGLSSTKNQSLVDKISFTSDTSTATATTNLTVARHALASVSDGNYAWFAGGYNNITSTMYSTVDKLNISNDTAAMVAKGNLAQGHACMPGVNNSTNGWFISGLASVNGAPASNIDMMVFASDTATATNRTTLTASRKDTGAVSNKLYGWVGGGSTYGGGWSAVSLIERLDYSNDTTSPIFKCNLSSARYRLCGAANSTNGYFAGGYTGSGTVVVNTIDKLTFASDTSTSSVGHLSTVRDALSSTANGTYIWFAGGFDASFNSLSIIDRLIFATDTSDAVSRSNLSVARGLSAGIINSIASF